MKKTKFSVATATAIVALLATPVAAAEPAASADPITVSFVGLKDSEVLLRLVSRYKADPFTFPASLKWIKENRPELEPKFVSRTAGSAGGQGINPGVAILTGGAAAVLAGVLFENSGANKDKPKPATYVPDPILGNPETFKTEEYYGNWGLNKINAADRYAEGAQGQGVKVAIMDTGIAMDSPEFAGRIDFANSHSFYGDPNDLSTGSEHGTSVASVIAAARDGKGVHGVAFGSELVVFKGLASAEEGPASSYNKFADSLDRSVAAGASVMNNSWSYVKVNPTTGARESIPVSNYTTRAGMTGFLGQRTISALDNARANDMLVVVAAGNDSFSEVSAVAGIPVAMPEFEGYVIAAVAVGENDLIAPFSNRCGIAKNNCLAAPGMYIGAISDKGEKRLYNGTSYAAPHITGSAAVLKSQNPELTSPEIARILFDTATDLGAPGVDEVYGHGLLNLKNARAPQGVLVIYEGESTREGKVSLGSTGVMASSAMEGALMSALSGKSLMAGDKYDRGYHLDAGRIISASDAVMPSMSMRMSSPVGQGYSVISSMSGHGISFKGDDVSYSVVRGQVREAGMQERLDPVSFMESDFSADYSAGIGSVLSLKAEIYGAAGPEAHASTSFGVEADFGDSSAYARVGALEEYGTVLGSYFMGAAGKGGSARTVFIEVGNSFDVARDTFISIQGTRSQTNFSQSGLISGGKGLAGSSGKLSVTKKGVLGGDLTASVSSPLQITSGEISVDIPTGRAASVGGMESTSVSRDVATVEIESMARPYDLGLSYVGSTGYKDATSIELNAGYRVEGSRSQPFLGVMLSHKF